MAKLKTSRSLQLCFLLLWASYTAWAVDPSRYISQYAHSSWTIQDGSFSGIPHAITQTTDGYLWIGTEAGLVRFDGVRFVPWVEPEGEHLPQAAIYSLLGPADGGLWIGTGVGLAHWKDGDLINYSSVVGRVNSIQEDEQGTVWMVRSRIGLGQSGPLCGITGKDIHCYGAADGLKCALGSSEVAIDRQANVWVGSSDALCRWRPGSSSIYLQQELKETEGLVGVSALSIGDDGAIWAGIARAGKKFGLRRLMNGVWKSYTVPGMDGARLAVNTLLLDRSNALWVGTVSQGIYRVYKGKADHFSSSDGLSSDAVQRFFQDKEGDIWVVTSKGIDCFRDLRVTTFSLREGLTADSAGSVLAAEDGALWIGNQGGLDILRQGALVRMKTHDGLPGQDITSLLEDHAGRMWIGVDRDLAVYDHKRFRLIKRADGSGVGVVVAMTEDTEHNIWASVVGNDAGLYRIRDFNVIEIPTPPHTSARALAPDFRSGILMGLRGGGLARYDDGRFESFSFNQGAAQDPVSNLLVDHDGTIWAATDHGLLRWKEGNVDTLNSRNGLPCDPIYALVRDNLGSLWLSTRCGFVAISDSELGRWQKQPDSAVKVKTYDALDGAQPGHASFQPGVSKSADGRLWFANDIFVQMIDPGHLEVNALAPPVHIEKIVADRRNYSPEDKLRLPALTRDLEIDYTALSFVVPQQVRFRYKLEGRDSDWQDPMTRRQAFYNDLRPGNYQFRVIACNNDGVWNEEGATLSFSIAPAWYQTTWFRVFFFAAILAMAWILYRVRVHQVAKAISARFDDRLSERTRMARELHDTFLQTIQGSKFVVDDGLEDPLDAVKMHRALGQVSAWLEQAIEEGRAALNSLRSSTILRNDLGPALKRAAESGVVPDGMTISVSVIGDARELHPIVRDELYRIGHEAIQNAKAHSHGSSLEIDLAYDHDLVLHIRDNGVGIDPGYAMNGREGHFGLRGMRERAARIGARLTILSSAESGTDILVVVAGNVSFTHPETGIFSRLRNLYRRAARHRDPL
ncbi:Membrane associated, signal transduction histidine kinase-like ATPase [Acidisarcina polymorpha]|uniref:Membrane associated, signal transduction histidine kinase-like ATPase n=1 Tax=Acidisarcina polymorpha TaxID=2211140 RepID=A0A2Z5FYE8_9BACT|nr:two-component regulator propeller domain-containing protein [Acidisarcina polymorpha]AXC11899.1 Membrane associated, signal transduction histidine kinase-like ATPase [Acidisarcina polymorpha]